MYYEIKTGSVMIRELPSSERPREKMISHGVSSLSNAELLAVLIGNGTGGCSAIDLSNRILALEPSISGLSGYQPEEFMKIPGIGCAKACSLVAAIELGRRISTTPRHSAVSFSNPEQAASLFMEEMRCLNKEKFRIAMLNSKNELIMKQDISVGGISNSSAHPREVFAEAVRKGANGIILVHNHPSGDPTPSAADIAITKQLCEAGQILGIRVLDHIIIGDGTYTSFKNKGLL